MSTTMTMIDNRHILMRKAFGSGELKIESLKFEELATFSK